MTKQVTGRAKRMQLLAPSPTVALTGRVAELLSAGKQVISLGAGEPDFPIPEHIKQAAIAAITENKNKYTPAAGILPLRNSVAKKLKNDYQLLADPKTQITIGCGGKQLLFNAILASVSDGDEVIIPAPYWVSYPELVSFAGGKSKIITGAASNGYKITPTELSQAITKQSRWLIINSPSNPSGEMYSAEELQALLSIVARHPKLGVISDDIYQYLVYSDNSFAAAASWAEQLGILDRVLVINGLSKVACMTGWRLGWAFGNSTLIKDITALNSQSITNASSIVQHAAIAALEQPMDYLPKFLNEFQRRRDFVVSSLNQMPGITCRMPCGAFYVYPECSGLIGRTTPQGIPIDSDTTLASYLLDNAGIALLPGVAFGCSPHLRISYATSLTLLEQAMQAMATAVNNLS